MMEPVSSAGSQRNFELLLVSLLDSKQRGRWNVCSSLLGVYLGLLCHVWHKVTMVFRRVCSVFDDQPGFGTMCYHVVSS